MSDVDFERRVERALRAPVPTSARAKQAIMEGVRRAARDEMHVVHEHGADLDSLRLGQFRSGLKVEDVARVVLHDVHDAGA